MHILPNIVHNNLKQRMARFHAKGTNSGSKASTQHQTDTVSWMLYPFLVEEAVVVGKPSSDIVSSQQVLLGTLCQGYSGPVKSQRCGNVKWTHWLAIISILLRDTYKSPLHAGRK